MGEEIDLKYEKRLAYIEKLLEQLRFVQWDRFVEDNISIRFYGWIHRKDNYCDFVYLEHYWADNKWFFTTSSDEYSELIHEIFFGTKEGHIDCNRVEDWFNIKNCIHLDKSLASSQPLGLGNVGAI